MIKLRIIKGKSLTDRQLSRLLDQMYIQSQGRLCIPGQTWSPQIDLYETEGAFYALSDVPGLNAEQIEVLVDAHHLRIAGCRDMPKLQNASRVHQAEIDYGSFSRTIHIPGQINIDEVEATMDNGMLRVRMPKQTTERTVVDFS